MPCILNAANEVVVQAFLNEKISFLQMPEIIEHAMGKATYLKSPGLEDYIQTDKEVRILTSALVKNRTKQTI
jgi:1-deoxy-D-xylulose-5-phosphate reductoisomerase